MRSSDLRAYRPPGYIGFVALLYLAFGHNWGVVGAAQAVLGALTSGLLVVLAARTVCLRVGVITGFLHALWPTAVVYLPVIASDNLLVFLLVGGLTCLTGAHTGQYRWWLAPGAGLCFGLMMLTRPSSLFTFPGSALLCLSNPLQRVWRPRVLLLCLVLTAAVLTPWLVRNYRLGYGFPVLSTQGGSALWWGNNWRTLDGASGAPPRFPLDRHRSEQDQNQFFRQKTLAWIRENPRRYLALSIVRLARQWGTQADVWAAKYFWPTEENDRLILATYWKDTAALEDVKAGRELESRSRRWHQRARVIVAPVMLLSVLLALLRPRKFAFVLLPLWSYIIGLALTVFAGRYRVTSDPLILVCVAALLSDLIGRTRETGRWLGRWAKLSLVVLVAAGSVFAYTRDWDRDWYSLPPGPAPQPLADFNAPNGVTLSLRHPERIKTASYRGCETTLAADEDGLRLDLQATGEGSSKPAGGLRIPVAGLAALRLRIALDSPENVDTLLVTGLDRDRDVRLRWTWRVRPSSPLPGLAAPATFVLVPGEPSAFFVADVEGATGDWDRLARVPEDRMARAEEVGSLVKELRLVLRLRPGTLTRLLVYEMAVALPTAPLALDPALGNWIELDLTRPEALGRLSGETQMAGGPDGLRLELRGAPEESGAGYGGLRVPVDGLTGAWLGLSVANPDDVDAITVKGVDAERKTRLRWEWRPGALASCPVPRQRMDNLLLPGQNTCVFTARESDTAVPVRELLVLIRRRTATDARVVLHSLAVASPPPRDERGAFQTEVNLRQAAVTPVKTKYCAVEVSRNKALCCTLRGTRGVAGRHYGGLCVSTPGLAAAWVEISFVEPQNLASVIVSGLDDQGQQVARWEWPVGARGRRPLPGVIQTYAFFPGQRCGDFAAKEAEPLAAIHQLRFIVRIQPGTTAAFTLHRLAVMPTTAPADAGASEIRAP